MTDPNILTDTRYFEQESPQPAGDLVLTDEKYFDQSKPAEEKSAFRRGLESGIDQLQALGGGMAAVAGDALGSDKLKDWGMETYQANQWEASENALDYGFTDIDGVGKAFEWAGYTLGNLAPSLATTVMGGGVGGLAAKGLSKKMVSNMVKKEMAKGLTQDKAQEVAGKALAKRIAMANSLGVNLGAASTSAGMATGGIYGDTGDVGVAVTHGLASGVLDALPVTRMLKKLGGDKAAGEFKQSLLKEGAKQGVFEGGTEAAQSFIEQHARHWVATDGQSLLQSLDEVDAKELIDSMAAGALGGSVMGVGSQAVGNIGKPKKGELTEGGEPEQPLPEVAQPEAAQEPMPSQPPGGFELTPGQARDFAQRDTQEQGADRGSLDPTVDYGKDFNPNLDAQPQSQFELTPEQAKEAAKPKASNDLVTFNDGSTATRVEVMEFVEDLKADGNEEGAAQLLNFAQNANGDWALPEAEQGDNSLPKPEENRHPNELPKPEEKVTTQTEKVTDTPEMSTTSGQVAPESLPTPQPATVGADLADGVPAQDIDAAANEAATSPKNDLPEPTDAQKKANNYKLGRIEVQGLKIGIENPKGSTRSGTDSDGKKWESKIHHHYGDLTGTKGADGDAIDVFVGDFPDSEKVFVVDQIDQKTGKFDEHKVMAGFDHKVRAVAAYKKNYEKGWKVGPVTEMSMVDFKAWLKGDTTKPLAKFSQEAKQVEPNKTQASVTDQDYLKAAQIRTNALPESHDRRRDLADLEEIGEAVKTGKTIDEFIAAEVENDPNSEYEWLSLAKGYKFNSKGQPFKKEKQAQLSRAFRETPEASVVPVTGGFAVAPAYKSRKTNDKLLWDDAQSRPEESGSQPAFSGEQPSINAGRAAPSDKQTATDKSTPTKKPVKKGKKSLFDAKRLDTMLLGSYGRYTDLGRESSSIDVVKDDAAKIIGFEIPFEVKVIEIEDKLVPMRFNLDERVIEVDAGISGINRGDAAMYMVEEVLHGLDVTGNGRTISASMKEFDFADGSVAKEAIHVFETEEKYRAFLAYPLDPIVSGQLSEDRQKAELFARLGVLYLGDPDNFKQSFPNAYKSFDKIFGLESRPAEDSAYVFRRNWTNTAPNVQGGNKRAPNGAVQQNASGAVRQGRGGQGLGQIRSAIAKAFSGNALGKRANLKDLSSSAGYLNTRNVESQSDRELMEKLGLAPKQAKTLSQKIASIKNSNLKSALSDFGKRVNEGIFDGLAGIKQAEDAANKGVKAGDYEGSGYVSARLATGVSDVMHAVLHFGAPKWKDGVIQHKEGTEGLLEILGELKGDLNNWLAWVAGNRAEELKAQGRENNLTDDDIRALKAKAEGKEELFNSVHQKYAAMNKAMLDLAQESGLLSSENRADWESEWYIPFYRETGGETMFKGARTKKGLSHQAAAIKRLKGSDLATNDLLENILSNWLKLVDSSMKNSAMDKITKNLEGSDYITNESSRWTNLIIPKGTLLRQVPNDRTALEAWANTLGVDIDVETVRSELIGMSDQQYRSLWRNAAPVEKGIVRVMRDGKPQFYRVHDDALLRATTHINNTAFNDPVTKTGRWFKRLLTTGVTASPDFILRNFVRDAVHSWAINPDGFKFGVDSIKGIKGAFTKDDEYRSLVFAGAAFQGGYVHGTDPEASAQIMRRALIKSGMTGPQADSHLGKVLNTPADMKSGVEKAWQIYREAGDKLENSNRLATFKKALAADKPLAQAIYESKDLMDFSLRGNMAGLIWLTDMVPFLNARLQGLSKLGRASKENPKEVGIAVSKIVGFSLFLAWLNEDEERYQELPDWQKDSYWSFFVGDEHFMIPKPFEIGFLAGTMPERAYHSWVADTQPDDKVLWALGHGIMETLNLNPIPQFALPLIETWGNRSFFFDTPIEGMSDQGKLPEARYSTYTSNTAIAIGKALGISPKKIEHVWEGYTGTMGAYALSITDMAVRGISDSPEQPAWKIEDLPVIKSFYKGDDPAKSTQYMTDMYDRYGEVYETYRTINAYRAEGLVEDAAELANENRSKLAYRKVINTAKKQISNLRKQRDKVMRNRLLTPEAKRNKINLINEKMTIIARRVSEQTEDAF